MLSSAARRELVESIVVALCAHDPIDLIRWTDRDEYSPEAEDIVAGLCARSAPVTAADAKAIVHATFLKMFGSIAGPPRRYRAIARDVRLLWTAAQT